jgi:hypothetical protein
MQEERKRKREKKRKFMISIGIHKNNKHKRGTSCLSKYLYFLYKHCLLLLLLHPYVRGRLQTAVICRSDRVNPHWVPGWFQQMYTDIYRTQWQEWFLSRRVCISYIHCSWIMTSVSESIDIRIRNFLVEVLIMLLSSIRWATTQ